MALINCPECTTLESDRAISCPSCGCPVSGTPQGVGLALSPAMASATGPQVVSVTKSRGIHIMLGIVFGAIGFHNFYSGHYWRGGLKLGPTVLAFAMDASTGFYAKLSLVLMTIFSLWALAEVIFVREDATGRKMS